MTQAHHTEATDDAMKFTIEVRKRPLDATAGSVIVWKSAARAQSSPARAPMSRVEVRDLGDPEAVVSYPLGTTNQVRLAQTVISRHVLQPGWSWEEHARPLVGTASCELYHRGVVLSGRMGVRTDAGEQLVIGPNQVFDLPPGHVTWVEGDEELVMVDWAGGAGFDARPGEKARVLATILFTDIVDSTVLARDAGDASWRRTVAMHDDVVRSVLAGFSGREVETAGDSFLVVFDSAEGAIRCGLALVAALDAIRLPIRVGIHSGEVDISDDQVRGLAVHAAARVLDQAGSGEVLLSGTTRDLAEGATGLTFESRGRHRLKGLEREYELFASTPPTGE
jgi:class 3 adenylate cyclase